MIMEIKQRPEQETGEPSAMDEMRGKEKTQREKEMKLNVNKSKICDGPNECNL